MEIKVFGVGQLEIKGLIKSINDIEIIKDTIEKQLTNNYIKLRVVDSFAFPSSILGYLIKLKSEGMKISMEVGDEGLYELLSDLNVIEEFDIQKIK